MKSAKHTLIVHQVAEDGKWLRLSLRFGQSDGVADAETHAQMGGSNDFHGFHGKGAEPPRVSTPVDFPPCHAPRSLQPAAPLSESRPLFSQPPITLRYKVN
jgi:hypothetical protein